MNNKLETISNLFENQEIRSVWNEVEEKYYFSVIDIVRVLTNNNNPAHYLENIKIKND